MRKYESGSTWCVWRWTHIPWRGVMYLVRLHLFMLPWIKGGKVVGGPAVMLHWILSPDPHPAPHDHPVSFLSITLRGGYMEWTPSGYVQKRVRFRRATDVHRIVEVEPGTLTLVFCGRAERSWGFHTSTGWIGWREYRRTYEG